MKYMYGMQKRNLLNSSTFHMAPHIYSFLYARRQGCAMSRETVYLYVWMTPLKLRQPSTRRLTLDFTSCYRFSPNYTHLTSRNFICNIRQSLKQWNSIQCPSFWSTSNTGALPVVAGFRQPCPKPSPSRVTVGDWSLQRGLPSIRCTVYR